MTVPLRIQLGILAMRFRGNRDPQHRSNIAREYEQIVIRLVAAGGWNEMPAPEDMLPDEFMPDLFFQYWFHDEDCMEYYALHNKSKIVLRFIPSGEKLWWREFHIPGTPTTPKRSRFIYATVVRGEEDKGIRWLSASKSLHEQIVKGVVDNLVPPIWWQSMVIWLAGWIFLGNFAKYLFPLGMPTYVVDLDRGYDFEINVEMKGGFPNYTGNFIKKSCPAGTKEQIKAWKEEAGKQVFAENN